MSPLAALIVLLSLLCPLHLCGAAVYYVRPTQTHNAPCPSDPCLTLGEYAVSSERYFTSNTTFLFLDGDHELSFSFNVSGIHNLTLKPYTDGSSVFVHPDPYNYVPLKMRFKVVSDVTVADLTFKSISFVFENSSSVTLTELAISADPDVPYNSSNPAAVISTRSYVLLTGCEFFMDGTAITSFGNSSIVLQGDVVFLGTNTFDNNCGISLHDGGVLVSEGNVVFRELGGGAISGGGNSTLILNGTVSFNNNYRHYEYSLGGAITLNESSAAVIVGNVHFTENQAYQGGAIGLCGNSHLVLKGTVTFTGHYALTMHMGGAILLTGLSTAVLDGYITFIQNTASLGGAIALKESSCAVIVGNVSFTKNDAYKGGAIGLFDNNKLVLNGSVTFTGNRVDVTGGAILSAINSSITLQGNITFIGNRADRGGAIALLGRRTIWLPETDYTLITFANNTAYDYGGALYFSGSPNHYTPLQCAFFFEHLPINPVFNFIDNTAGEGGDAIYGAYFQRKCITPSEIMHTSEYFPSILNNISLFSPSFLDDPSLISSDPVDVCLCKDGRPDCLVFRTSQTVYISW